MAIPFQLTSKYYDLFYQSKDSSSEAQYVDKILKHYRIPGENILEFGSGTGRHGSLLSAHGYKVHGIELCSEMVSKAKQTNGFTCEQGDIRIINLKKKYDAVVSLFHVVSYSITNNAVASVFNNAFRHLNKDGLFVFDFWYSPAVYSQKPEIRVKRLSSDDCYITRIAEPILYPNENRVDVNYTIIANDTSNGNYYSFEETHPMRHFSLPELDQFAELAGFERLTAEEWLTGNNPSEDTWGVCIVLRKT